MRTIQVYRLSDEKKNLNFKPLAEDGLKKMRGGSQGDRDSSECGKM